MAAKIYLQSTSFPGPLAVGPGVPVTDSSGSPSITKAAVIEAGTTEMFRVGAAGLLTLQGQTTAFPALKRNAAALEVRLGDDTDYAQLNVSVVRNAKTFTVATLPTGAVGMRAYVTDATVTTFASIVAGGGANIVPVFHNGTNWIIG